MAPDAAPTPTNTKRKSHECLGEDRNRPPIRDNQGQAADAEEQGDMMQWSLADAEYAVNPRHCAAAWIGRDGSG